MPQPVSRVHPNAGAVILSAGGAPLKMYPRLAGLAMTVIHRHAQLEALLLETFIQLMGGNKTAAAAIYLSLETNSAKQKAITALATSTIQPLLGKVLIAIVKQAKSCQKQRDALAHGLWGISREIPNALLLVEAKKFFTTDNAAMNDHIYVYRESDFLKLAESTGKVISFLLEFKLHISRHPTSGIRRSKYTLSALQGSWRQDRCITDYAVVRPAVRPLHNLPNRSVSSR
jgi:hypothetical protein